MCTHLRKALFRSSCCSMTFLIFFAAAARTRVIAANLWRVTLHLMWAGFTIATHLTEDHILPLLLPFDLFFHLLFFNRLQQEKESQGIFIDAIHQVFEQVVGFLLVLHQRIALPVTPQADSFL